MSVLIKARQSSIVDKESGKKLFYPHTVRRGQISTDDLARLIAEKSSLTTGDIRNVIENLGEAVEHYFRMGYSVKLEKLGSFSLGVRSAGKGVEKAEDVSAKQINSAHVNFREEQKRSGNTTRNVLSGELSYKLYTGVDPLEEEPDPDPNPDDGGNGGGEGGGDDLLG